MVHVSDDEVASLREGVEILSAAWTYVYVDEIAAGFHGRPAGELVGRALAECQPGIEQTPLFGVLLHCMRARVAGRCDAELRGGNDSTSRVAVRVAPCIDGLMLYLQSVAARERASMPPPVTDRLWLIEDRRAPAPSVSEVMWRHELKVDLLVHEPDALLNALARRSPAHVLIDLSYARRDRVWLINALARRFSLLKVVAIAPGAGPEVASSFKLLGAAEVVTAKPLTGAIMRQARGPARLEARPVAVPSPPMPSPALDRLTPREREVLSHIANGADNLKVAAALGIAERTVKSHVTSLFRKIGAENRVELALAARGIS